MKDSKEIKPYLNSIYPYLKGIQRVYLQFLERQSYSTFQSINQSISYEYSRTSNEICSIITLQTKNINYHVELQVKNQRHITVNKNLQILGDKSEDTQQGGLMNLHFAYSSIIYIQQSDLILLQKGRILIWGLKQENIDTIIYNIFIMKYLTYILTFLAYASVHILRMSYSAVKPKFEKTFQLDSIFLGLFDGLIYISLGMGFFLRFFIEGHTKKTTIYLIFGIITSFSYMVLPIMSLLLTDEVTKTIGDQPFFIRYVVPGVSLIFFGFGQFTAWPILLYLVSQQFNIQKQGTILGIWSANGDVGNIVGFLLSNLILKALDLPWEYVMITGGLIYLVFAFLIAFTFKDNVKTNQLQDPLFGTPEYEKTRKEKFFQFLTFSREIIRSHKNKLFLVAMGLLKSILYGFLLWMPTYLTHKGQSEIATWAPTVFNVCTVFGSALLGYFYKQKPRVNETDYKQLSTGKKCLHKLFQNMKSYSLFYSCLFISFCLTVFFSADNISVLVTMFLSAIIGFFLGGSFNMCAGNEVMSITGGVESKVEMLSTLSMAIGNVMVGIVEIIIGLALNVKKDFSKERNLFIVLLTICGLAALILLIRSTMMHKNRIKQGKLLDQKGGSSETIVSQN